MAEGPLIIRSDWSETRLTAPDSDHGPARVVVRVPPEGASGVRRALEAWPGPPFQRVLSYRQTPQGTEVELERFVGVSARAVTRLCVAGRVLLPLDVWLGLAVRWLDALPRVKPALVGLLGQSLGNFGLTLFGDFMVSLSELNSLTALASNPRGDTDHLRGPAPSIPPPEVLRAVVPTERSVVFAAAAALTQLLTARNPFQRDSFFATLRAVSAGVPLFGPFHPQAPRELEAVLRAAMSVDPRERFPDAREFSLALTGAARVAPAKLDRIAAITWAVARSELDGTLFALRSQPEWLPAALREPAISVLEDGLLERMASVDELVPMPPPSKARAAPPRVNLAQPPRGNRRWWPF